MIVDLERNDLARVCEPGSIRWPELMAQRELAGVTHLVSTVEGTLRARRHARRDPRRDVPRRLGHRRAEDRGRRPDRRARAGRARRLDGRARRASTRRRLRAGADDPHLRRRRGPRPPLGRRRHRLGLRSRGRDRGVAGSRRGRCSPRSAGWCPRDAAPAAAVAGAASSIRPSRSSRRRGAPSRRGRVRDDAHPRRPAVLAATARRAARALGLALRLPPPDGAASSSPSRSSTAAGDRRRAPARLFQTGQTLLATRRPAPARARRAA